MTELAQYASKYENVRFEREDGVLQITLHTKGKPFVFSEQAHHDLGFAFYDVADDPQNKVIILTGAGDRFCADFNYASFIKPLLGDTATAVGCSRTDGRRMLAAFLDIEVPVIAAINGPAVAHSELPLLSDVVLAADHTIFRDATHFVSGAVPGDGMHTVWTALLGLNRGRYFLLTGQTIGAQEALSLGVVGEVLPQAELLKRAREIAAHWARLPRNVLISTRHSLTYEWKRLLTQQLHNGLTEEYFAGFPQTFARVDPESFGTVDLLK